MAAYGAQLRRRQDATRRPSRTSATSSSTSSSQDKSAREALQTFLAGRGDVLLAYENEAIFANQNNQELPYVIPKATILIENPIAVTSRRRRTRRPRTRSSTTSARPRRRRSSRENGYRPVVPAAREGLLVPGSPAAVLDQVARRLGEGRQPLLQPEQRDRDRDPARGRDATEHARRIRARARPPSRGRAR